VKIEKYPGMGTITKYNKSEKRWCVTYANDKEEVTKELLVDEENIVKILQETKLRFARLCSNAGQKRRRREGEFVGR
jgi:acetyl-CoA carboxylase carboxyltransferase component